MTTKVKVHDTKTGDVHEVFSVDAKEMVEQADGRYEFHGKPARPKKGPVVKGAVSE